MLTVSREYALVSVVRPSKLPPTMRYQHTQVATVILAVMALIALVMAVIAALSPVVRISFITVVSLLAVVGALFHSLTVKVSTDWIECSFGPGFIHRRIALSRISDARPVRNLWWYGFGIRLTPKGWLWNVSGLDAVELIFKDGGKFRIGTDEPEELAAAIRMAITTQA
jgi:hypothetical protein